LVDANNYIGGEMRIKDLLLEKNDGGIAVDITSAEIATIYKFNPLFIWSLLTKFWER